MSALPPRADWPSALAVPLAGITTTAVLLAQAATRDRLVVAAIDSRLGDWFCAIGEGDGAPFVTSARDLAVRIAGRPCRRRRPGAKALADDLLAAGIDTIVEEALPDPVALARLAGRRGVDAWRARNAEEGLPRPLYLRGVNITLPDGARRTVD